MLISKAFAVSAGIAKYVVKRRPNIESMIFIYTPSLNDKLDANIYVHYDQVVVVLDANGPMRMYQQYLQFLQNHTAKPISCMHLKTSLYH